MGLERRPNQIAAIAERIVAAGHSLLVTRTDRAAFEAVSARLAEAKFHELARTITLALGELPPGRGTIVVAAAGTADLPVAEEAAVSAELMGNAVDRLYDVGVAGLHRLLAEHARLTAARVIIVVAGMEGALPSVVGGLVSVPVIAVPTSVGYGASFGGVDGAAGDAQQLRERRVGRQYRQRLRRGGDRELDQSSGLTRGSRLGAQGSGSESSTVCSSSSLSSEPRSNPSPLSSRGCLSYNQRLPCRA